MAKVPQKARQYIKLERPYIVLAAAGLLALAWLMLYKLGSLVGGLSSGEWSVATTPIGWHGLYNHAFYLPLQAVRAVDFFVFSHHGQTLTRLPNAIFGALTVISYVWLIWRWHGRRTAILAGCLFAGGAWILHASRLASFDVMYLWIIPVLLLANVTLQRHRERAYAFYGNMLLWGLLLYIPGAVWLVLINMYFQRKLIAADWKHFNAWWQRGVYALVGVVWLPLLVLNLQSGAAVKTWLGLPAHLEGPVQLLKHFAGVFVHLFVRGPLYPDLWLARAPILDVLTLVLSLIGIYFYATRLSASRSRLLFSFFAVGAILVALNGPVGLSLLVPLVYILAATGLTYFTQQWLRVFPLNPLARGFGLALVTLAVALACVYNLRAYYVAWPHNDVTRATFFYRV